uniref:RNA-dependent RNA polymerase n=1 Tax=Macrostomum lignano TaxID=282301 RepID=A0A1I8F671_9PLAT
MGGNYSYLPSEPASNNFFCITFRVPDSIKVIDCDPPTLEIVRKAIARGYRRDCGKYDKYGSTRTFVLAGNPFKLLFFERTNEACVNYDSTVCCIALSGFDKFQLVNFPKQLLAKVADAVRRTWTLGIQEEMKDAYGSMEMKDERESLLLNAAEPGCGSW